MYDLLIQNAIIIDGTGASRFQGDIAVRDGVIVEVYRGSAEESTTPSTRPSSLNAKKTIDAKGLIVTPGFVDFHTHYDGQITWDPYLSPSTNHGVTTAIMGNCGVGFAPCKKEDRDWLINVMEGVEDIPGSALHEGIQWGWETFPEYLDFLSKRPLALDVGTQVPHAAVRAWVMGKKSAENEAPTEAQRNEMAAIVEEAVRAGAFGFTTSRTPLHKTAEGVLVAGTFAPLEELTAMAQALARAGHGVFEVAPDHLSVPDEFPWMKELAKQTGRNVVFNLSQTDFDPELWMKGLALLEDAAKENIPIYGQSAGRAIGILMGWRCTAHPFARHPSFLKIAMLPWEEQKKKLADPEFKRQLLAEEQVELTTFEQFVTQGFYKMYPMREANYEPRLEENVANLAEREGRSPLEVAYDLLSERDFEAMIYFPLFNYADNNLDLLHRLHQHPRVKMGLADGGAHCGAICDAGMPTFMLAFWARDRQRGPTLPLEHMIHRQTKQTAEFYGLNDRGVIAAGYKADFNVIDFEKLQLQAPRLVFDLPAQGRRLLQDATGYKYTIVSGVVTFEDGKATGALPGQLLRASL